MKDTFKPRSYPIQRDGYFWNNHHEKPRGFLWHSIQMLFKSWHRRRTSPAINPAEWTIKADPSPKSEAPIITWIGHSTFLIQIGGINIITDPIFGAPSWFFPRIFRPGIEPSALPPIDVVIVSHNHRDHMDARSILHLNKFQPTFHVPIGNKPWLLAKKINHIQEHFWWEKTEIMGIDQKPVIITFLPAHHWSQRGIFDRNKTLWGSWLIEYNGFKIYFAGDTAYSDHFKEVGAEFQDIDVALMPIGPCKPHDHMKHSHVDAQQAVQGFNDLGAHHFIPMHWGTFNFGIDHFHEPLELLQETWSGNQSAQAKKTLHILKIGQSVSF